jgi:hypothetical protein
VVLARMLRDAGGAGLRTGSSGGGGAQLEGLLREFEQQRIKRCLPLTLRSWAFGFALQLPYPPVRAAAGVLLLHWRCGTGSRACRAAQQAQPGALAC